MAPQLDYAHPMAVREASVGTVWTKIVSAKTTRQYLMIQNLATDTTELAFETKPAESEAGFALGFVAASAGGAHEGTRHEMTQPKGNLTLGAVYARASAGENNLIIMESPAPVFKPADVSSSSSSSSSTEAQNSSSSSSSTASSSSSSTEAQNSSSSSSSSSSESSSSSSSSTGLP